MPLIILTGIPSSGKTTRANELKDYFESKRDKKVEIISEVDAIVKAGYDKNKFYSGMFILSQILNTSLNYEN